MTSRRFRRSRNPVRRTFFTGSGSATALATNMVDLTLKTELGSTSDSQTGDVLVTGVALIDLVDEAAIHQAVLWVGRTSTEPDQADTGVRTRQFAANSQGLPFVIRFRGLRVDPGMIMKFVTHAIAETDAAIVHQNIVSAKWSFREMRQG